MLQLDLDLGRCLSSCSLEEPGKDQTICKTKASLVWVRLSERQSLALTLLSFLLAVELHFPGSSAVGRAM